MSSEVSDTILGVDGQVEKSSAERMVEGATHSGLVLKESKSQWQRMVPCLEKNTLKPRFLVLKGSYLFRYKNRASRWPKGVPIALGSTTSIVTEDGVELDPVENDSGEDLETLPSDSGYSFTLQTIRKQYRFLCNSKEEQIEWVKIIQETKNKAIRASLGHTSLSNAEKEANQIGRDLARISARKEAHAMQTDDSMSIAMQ